LFTGSLELIHPDVTIIRGVEILSDIAMSEFETAVNDLSDDDKAVFYDFDDTDPENAGTKIYSKLQKLVKDKLNELNSEIFDDKITDPQIDEWITNDPVNNSV